MSRTPNQDDASVTDPSLSISAVVEKDQGKGNIRSEAHRNYSFAAAAWLAILATPLLLFPRILSLIFGSLLTVGEEGEEAGQVIRQLNVLERTLAGTTGVSLLALAFILVIQTGAVPLTASISTGGTKSPDALFRTPTIVVTTAFFTALLWYSYELGLWFVTAGSGVLTVWGFWAITFGNESHVNKTHNERSGAGVSSFPFKNSVAEEEKKAQ